MTSSYPQKFTLAQYFEVWHRVLIHHLKKKLFMKKTIVVMGTILLSLITLTAGAQQTWEAQKNPTVDSIASKYKDKMVATPAALTQEGIFPVIGRYESATNPETPSVSLSLDAQNKGIVWVEGLPQGKVKGLLTKSPATYKIPAQKNEEGKNVAEGTLIYDKELNTLSICIGKDYNADNPSAAFTEPATTETLATTKTTKSKNKPVPKAWIYTGTKVEKATAGN